MAAETKVGILIEAQDRASRTLKDVGNSVSRMEASFQRSADASKKFAMALGAAATAVGGLVGYGVKVAADLETAEIGLETLLGSAEEASTTVERIKKEAARTPFELPGLTQAVQLLSSVTKDGDKSIDILMDIGEGLAAMGKGQAELDRIIVNLQQVGAIGYASMVDIKQFAYAGIPIFEMLQETTGKTGDALADMISNGEISFEMLTQMFDEANDAGGRFHNAFVNQAGSFNQLVSNMKDSFGIFLSDLAMSTGIFDALKGAMNRVIAGFDWLTAKIPVALEWLKENKDVVAILAGVLTGMLVPAFIAVTGAVLGLAATLAPWAAAGGLLVMLIQRIGGVDAAWNLMKTAVDKVRGAFEFFKPMLEIIWAQLQVLWAQISQQLLPALLELWRVVSPVLTPVLKVLAAVVGTTLLVAIQGIIAVIQIFVKLLTAAVDWSTALASFFKGIFTGSIEDLGRAWENLVDSLAPVIDSLKQVYEWAKKAWNWAKRAIGAGGGGDRESVDDAVIAPSGKIISTNPRDYLIATQNPAGLLAGAGGGTNIYIQGGYYLDERAAEDFGNKLVDIIKREQRIG